MRLLAAKDSGRVAGLDELPDRAVTSTAPSKRVRPLTKAKCDNCRHRKIKVQRFLSPLSLLLFFFRFRRVSLALLAAGPTLRTLPTNQRGCDNKLPRCTRCIRSDLPCQTSKRELQFVFSRPSTAAHGPTVAHQHTQILARVPANPFSAPSLRRTAVVDRCCSSLFPSDPTGWTSDTMSVLNVLQGRERAGDAVAMAASYCLAVTQDSSLRAYSLEAYCRAVSQMRALATDFKKNWRRLLESSLLLFLYEVCLKDNKCPAMTRGTSSHLQGMTSVLKLVGPTAFQAEPFHSLFLCARFALVSAMGPIVCIGTRLAHDSFCQNSKDFASQSVRCQGATTRNQEPCSHGLPIRAAAISSLHRILRNLSRDALPAEADAASGGCGYGRGRPHRAEQARIPQPRRDTGAGTVLGDAASHLSHDLAAVKDAVRCVPGRRGGRCAAPGRDVHWRGPGSFAHCCVLHGSGHGVVAS
ncbi:hypothetical protein IF2G_07714 [Cordyceps javanica]|nr:hypothetical protein IF2G_07714 [Cordyceps javanica]